MEIKLENKIKSLEKKLSEKTDDPEYVEKLKNKISKLEFNLIKLHKQNIKDKYFSKSNKEIYDTDNIVSIFKSSIKNKDLFDTVLDKFKIEINLLNNNDGYDLTDAVYDYNFQNN